MILPKFILFYALMFLISGCWHSKNIEEQKLIDNAIEYYLINQKKHTSQQSSNGDWEVIQIDTYKTKAEFLEDYPSCCEFSYRGSEG